MKKLTILLLFALPILLIGQNANTPVLNGGSTADGTETIVTGGSNVTITGTGSTTSPYVINSAGGGTVTESTTAGQTPFTNPPASPVEGDEFLNTTDGIVWIYDGTNWLEKVLHETVTVLSENVTKDSILYFNENGDRYAVSKGGGGQSNTWAATDDTYIQQANQKSTISFDPVAFNGTLRLTITSGNGSNFNGSVIIDYAVRLQASGIVNQSQKVVSNSMYNLNNMFAASDIYFDSGLFKIDIYGVNGITNTAATTVYLPHIEIIAGANQNGVSTIINSIAWTKNIVHADAIPAYSYEQSSGVIPVRNTHADAINDATIRQRSYYRILNDNTIYTKL